MHYCIGDIHGCFDEMLLLIQKIENTDKDAEFIFLGDFIDRGPKVWETVNWAMENITKDGKYQSVRGNHEQLAIEWMNNYKIWLKEPKAYVEPRYHFDYDRVLYAHRDKDIKRTENFAQEDFEKSLAFFKSLPFDIALPIKTKWGKEVTFRIVHAGYAFGETKEEIQHECNLWDRSQFGNFESEEIVIHGHTPTINIDYLHWDVSNTNPGMISYRRNMINIDGGCVFYKDFAQYPCMLCALCLETLEEIYPWTVKERFLQYSGDEDPRYAEGYALNFSKEYLSRKIKERERILWKMGNPEYAFSDGEHRVGFPLYEEGQDVDFIRDGKKYSGTIELVMEMGIHTDRSQPYYDILVWENKKSIYYHEIAEEDIKET